jgi:hypothetical protein
VLQQEALAERPDGWELLTPVEQLRSSAMAEAQADILDLFEALGMDLGSVAPDAAEAKKPTNVADEFELVVPEDESDAEAEKPANDIADIPVNGDTLRAIGRLGNVLENHAVDKDEFAKWDTGRGSQERVMNLAMWYLGELGE